MAISTNDSTETDQRYSTHRGKIQYDYNTLSHTHRYVMAP